MSAGHYQQEVEQLYSCTLAQGIRSLAICSALPKQGATTILRLLAQRNVLAGASTLVVDFNLSRPGVFNVIDFPNHCAEVSLDGSQEVGLPLSEMPTPQLVSVGAGDSQFESLFNGICIPQDKSTLLKLRETDVLRRLIQRWLQEYDTVLVDTTALLATDGYTIPAQQVASVCDGCLLVVLSGYCTQAQLTDAVECLNQQQVNLIGTVMNDQYHPRLIDEMKRELNRLNWLCPRLVRWTIKKLNRVSLLSMDI
ncbi:hypothetical protein [Photobacterium nomapromontoriensis]|uniref:hypothetical protein n=1 Tax=Photobacterium nomapromontoriensis TaxID=2910237 RepID=UPI003D09A33B